MGVEIERKFLVISDSWKAKACPGIRFCQGSVAREQKATVRVRRANDKAYITIKGPRDGISRAEFEYMIPIDDAEEMLSTLCSGTLIEKTRHRVSHAGAMWDVDVYAGLAEGLTIAEVELDNEDTPLQLPPWVGIEVTNDARFRNSSIGLEPEVAKALAAGMIRPLINEPI